MADSSGLMERNTASFSSSDVSFDASRDGSSASVPSVVNIMQTTTANPVKMNIELAPQTHRDIPDILFMIALNVLVENAPNCSAMKVNNFYSYNDRYR